MRDQACIGLPDIPVSMRSLGGIFRMASARGVDRATAAMERRLSSERQARHRGARFGHAVGPVGIPVHRIRVDSPTRCPDWSIAKTDWEFHAHELKTHGASSGPMFFLFFVIQVATLLMVLYVWRRNSYIVAYIASLVGVWFATVVGASGHVVALADLLWIVPLGWWPFALAKSVGATRASDKRRS